MSEDTPKIKRPRNKTLIEVITYLESINLNVYGSAVCLETGAKSFGLMDYTPENVVKYRKLLEAGKIAEEIDDE